MQWFSLQECSNREVGEEEELAFNLVDAFSVPRFTYCEERKKYLADDALGRPGPKLYAGKEREYREDCLGPSL